MSQTEVNQQNQDLKVKYKKSLQQLMNILKVNKSLKEFLDTMAREKDSQITNLTYKLNENDLELKKYQNICAQYKEKINIEEQNKAYLTQQNSQMIKQIGKLKQNNSLLQKKIEELQTKKMQKDLSVSSVQQEELLKVRSENQLLKKKLMPSIQAQEERERMLKVIQNLKETVGQLNQQLFEQKEKYRNQIFSKETQFMRSKESESERLKTIESKYQLLESELNNYKNMQKYFEDEAKSIINQENAFNNIREQIERINQDFNKYEMESCNLLLKKREEDAEKNRKIEQLQQSVQNMNKEIHKLKLKIKEKDQELDQTSEARQTIKKLQKQKRTLSERIYVLEALTVTQKYRSGGGLTDRIKQFQSRIHLLIEEKPEKNEKIYGGLQQIIILKSYIIELSQQLNKAKKKEQHLQKKVKNYKASVAEVNKAHIETVKEYKKKISGYDALVSKLYGFVEEKMKERVPEEMQKEFTNAIAHYEEKMIAMSEEIVHLRNQKELIESEMQKPLIHDDIEKDNEMYIETIKDLTVKVNVMEQEMDRLKLQSQQLQKMQQELSDKDKLIEEMAAQLRQANNVQVNNTQMQRLQKQVADQQEEITYYVEQLQQLNVQLIQQQNKKKENSNIQKEVQMLKNQNRAILDQNNNQREELMEYFEEISRKVEKIKSLQKQLEKINQEKETLLDKFDMEITELNSTITTLRTTNVSLKTQIQCHQSVIDQLKHQVFIYELRGQKQRSPTSSMLSKQKDKTSGLWQSKPEETTMRSNELPNSSFTQAQSSVRPELSATTKPVFEQEEISENASGDETLLKRRGAVVIKRIV